MTSINTVNAKQHWGDETKYLEKIQLVALTEDQKNVSIITDEEGNNEIILTPKSARFVATTLVELADYLEKKKVSK